MANQPNTYIAGSFSEWILQKMTPDGPDLVITLQAIPDVEYQYKFAGAHGTECRSRRKDEISMAAYISQSSESLQF